MRISDWSSDVCSSDLSAALAALVLWHLYDYYTYAPQTRDGKLRADVVPLAADVSGRVDSVAIHDGQVVEKGQSLFTIDKVRLRNALAQAEEAVATAPAPLPSAESEARRYAAVGRAKRRASEGDDVELWVVAEPLKKKRQQMDKTKN